MYSGLEDALKRAFPTKTVTLRDGHQPVTRVFRKPSLPKSHLDQKESEEVEDASRTETS